MLRVLNTAGKLMDFTSRLDGRYGGITLPMTSVRIRLRMCFRLERLAARLRPLRGTSAWLAGSALRSVSRYPAGLMSLVGAMTICVIRDLGEGFERLLSEVEVQEKPEWCPQKNRRRRNFPGGGVPT